MAIHYSFTPCQGVALHDTEAVWGLILGSVVRQHLFYYMFGFLGLVFFILVVTCAEIALVLCYLHLVTEDYRSVSV